MEKPLLTVKECRQQAIHLHYPEVTVSPGTQEVTQGIWGGGHTTDRGHFWLGIHPHPHNHDKGNIFYQGPIPEQAGTTPDALHGRPFPQVRMTGGKPDPHHLQKLWDLLHGRG